ncbi:replication protein [Dolosigranulum pigrum]|uniref:phage replisome organizer N-terminal domain-containing protein n=1 Tax=Dolosigranulum pigrum TaxID=29394 RepID=UPI001AD86058|nr:phage replisome organizer N-terminal domain-containing protein [Dolosigranulum pigrum]QTJ49186.1 replication protein [Dolosigranulum pigrum]
MSDVQWIKLSINMFSDEKIRLIRTMPEGEAIVLIWVQLLCLAGKTNDSGSIYIGQNLYYTDEMLASLFDQKINVMRIALDTLEQFGMIEVGDNGVIDIVNWEKHQNVEGMERIRLQNRKRKQRFDMKKKIERLGYDPEADEVPHKVGELKDYVDELESNVTVTLPVTESNATDKNRIDKNRIDKESMSGKPDSLPYSEIINYLNEKANRQFKITTKKTQSLIKARFNDGWEVEDFKTVIDKKTQEWMGDGKMENYLRPETLFGTKFESYLNQNMKVVDKEQGGSYADIEF